MRAQPHPLFQQKTVAREVATSGVGIHSGQTIHLRLLPAPADTGIVFRRVDAGGMEISALATEVSSVDLATTIGRDDVTVSTIEHLLAAIRVADVDNLFIELDAAEVPILDGSARPFLSLLDAAGTRQQNAPRRILAITRPLEVEIGAKKIRLSPYPGLRVSYQIDFACAAIGHQRVDVAIDRAAFDRELAPARTFALASDVERMISRGLGLGGATDNCVIFAEDGPVNTELRFADEPVRHKALDAVGDLALLGAPLWAFVEVERGGHQLHYAMVEALRSRPDCWTWLEGVPREPEAAQEVEPRREEAQPALALAYAPRPL
jgi:UDP-3-O-[3-hydroxymyristoyl] N-acetylglucosamine deacetylase